MSNEKGKHLLIISGPSGCGKDSVVQLLLARCDWLGLSVSATTRAPRPGEVDGQDYYFLTPEDFEQLIADDQLIEYTKYVGNYYGTLKSEVDERIMAGKAVVLVIEVEGAARVKKMYPEATAVFILPPSFDELERRLLSRGTESILKVRERLRRAHEELPFAKKYDYNIVNDDLEKCADEVERIFSANRARA